MSGLRTTPARGEALSLSKGEPREPSAPVLRQAQDERKSGTVRIAGYAALFDVADGARDTIRKGAFARTIAEQPGELPLFWQHKPELRIGTIEKIAEDERGLRVIARIDKADSLAMRMLQRREVSGLSFGYRARGYRSTPGGRVLEDIDLFEISLVTHPLQSGARVHMVQ